MSDAQAFINQAYEVLGLAERIGSGHPEQDPLVRELATLNGLLAIAIVEVMAKPVVGPLASVVSLRSAIEPETAKAF